MSQDTNSSHKAKMNKKQNELYLYDFGHAYAEMLCEEADLLVEKYKDLPVPDSLDRWFEEYCQELDRKAAAAKRKRVYKKYLSRAAAVFLVLLVSSAAVTMSVDAFRVRFLNLFIEEKNDHNVVKFEEDSQNIEWPDDWTDFYTPSYIPDGYQLDEAQGNSSMKTMLFTDSAGKILIITQSTGNTGMNLDSEQANSIRIAVNDRDAVMMDKDGVISITWSADGTIFSVTGEEDVGHMIQIAEKLKKVAK